MAGGASADVSVRVAWADDAAAVAHLQLTDWADRYAGLVPADDLPDPATDVDAAAAAWHASLAKPPDARMRVLVALERNTVVGFAVTGPSTDDDCDPVAVGAVSEFTVSAERRGQGHGSRLMQACADTLRADRFAEAVLWLASVDDDLRGFAEAGGWAPDGASRELAVPGSGARLKQVRLHTALGDAS